MAEDDRLDRAIAAAAEQDEAEQLDLLPLPLDAEDARRRRAAELAGRQVARRGPGRPPGSKNKRQEDLVDWILAKYRSPLVGFAETFSRPVDELAKDLCCARLEAFKLQLQAMEKLAPYIHQKQPVAVQIDPGGLVQLVILAPGAQAAGDSDGAMTLEGELLPPEEDDGKSET